MSMVVDTIGVTEITEVECEEKKDLRMEPCVYMCMSAEGKYLRNTYEHGW